MDDWSWDVDFLDDVFLLDHRSVDVVDFLLLDEVLMDRLSDDLFGWGLDDLFSDFFFELSWVDNIFVVSSLIR